MSWQACGGTLLSDLNSFIFLSFVLTLAISLYTFPIYKVLMLKTFPDVNKNVDAYCLEIPYAAKYEIVVIIMVSISYAFRYGQQSSHSGPARLMKAQQAWSPVAGLLTADTSLPPLISNFG